VTKVLDLHLSFTVDRSRLITTSRLMSPTPVWVLSEFDEFSFKALRIPEER